MSARLRFRRAVLRFFGYYVEFRLTDRERMFRVLGRSDVWRVVRADRGEFTLTVKT